MFNTADPRELREALKVIIAKMMIDTEEWTINHEDFLQKLNSLSEAEFNTRFLSFLRAGVAFLSGKDQPPFQDYPDMHDALVAYAMMVLGIPNEIFRYKDPNTGKLAIVRIDESYMERIEAIICGNRRDTVYEFRSDICKSYGRKMSLPE